jgi:hypothetical protein
LAAWLQKSNIFRKNPVLKLPKASEAEKSGHAVCVPYLMSRR